MQSTPPSDTPVDGRDACVAARATRAEAVRRAQARVRLATLALEYHLAQLQDLLEAEP